MAAIILFAMLAAGLVLLRRGWRGHRAGVTPYCGSCGYNLTALASSECPECGKIVTDDAIVFGELHRRPKQMIAGVFFLAMAVLLIVAGTRQWLPGINWYAYKPTFWVVADTRSSDMRLATKAYRELQSRLKDSNLSDHQCRKAAEAALAEMTSPTPRPSLNHVDLLDALRQAGKLSDEQLVLFLENIVTTKMRVRPQSIARIGVPYKMSGPAQAGHQTGLWVEVGTEEASLSPQPARRKYDSWARMKSGGGGYTSGVVKVPGPGVHEIYQPIRIRVYDGSNLDPAKSVLLHEAEKVLSIKATVLAEEPPDFIKVVTSPDLAQAVQSSLQIERLGYSKHNADSLEARFRIAGPPVDLAFSVAVIAGGKEVGSGSLTTSRGKTTSYGTSFACKVPDLTEVDLVLTPDVDAAKRTVDLTEIWGKPIRFEKVQVERASSQPGS